jgi:hypothetical protein
MSAYYIVPQVPTVVGPPQSPAGPTANAPNHLLTDLAGQKVSCMPYGGELYCLVAIGQPNVNFGNEDDVFAFPADLTQLLTDSDVANITNYFSNANIPYSFAVAGSAWSSVLIQVAQIFVLAQALYGATQQAIFNGTGATLDSTVANASNASHAKGRIGQPQAPPSAIATAAGGTANMFDLSNVQDTDTVSDTLINVSQQFTSPITLGGTL